MVAPLVMVCGSRSLPAAALPLVGRVVADFLAAGSRLAVGCAAGADAAALAAALAAGAAPRVSVFAVGGADGSGFAGSVSAVAGVRTALAAGAVIKWWSGGSVSVPLRERLAARSLACVRAAAAGGLGSAPVWWRSSAFVRRALSVLVPGHRAAPVPGVRLPPPRAFACRWSWCPSVIWWGRVPMPYPSCPVRVPGRGCRPVSCLAGSGGFPRCNRSIRRPVGDGAKPKEVVMSQKSPWFYTPESICQQARARWGNGQRAAGPGDGYLYHWVHEKPPVDYCGPDAISVSSCAVCASIRPVSAPVSPALAHLEVVMSLSPLFKDADLIPVYTRAQALADGVLVDVTETAKEAGFRAPVALTVRRVGGLRGLACWRWYAGRARAALGCPLSGGVRGAPPPQRADCAFRFAPGAAGWLSAGPYPARDAQWPR